MPGNDRLPTPWRAGRINLFHLSSCDAGHAPIYVCSGHFGKFTFLKNSHILLICDCLTNVVVLQSELAELVYISWIHTMLNE
jgi:hypothetical protein